MRYAYDMFDEQTPEATNGNNGTPFTDDHARELNEILAQERQNSENPPYRAKVERYTQQSFAEIFETFPAETFEAYCLPTAFFMVAKATETRDFSVRDGPREFMVYVWFGTRQHVGGVPRPTMSKVMREQFFLPVVSWQTGRNTKESLTDENLNAMKSAGYIATPEEEAYFKYKVVDRDIASIVAETPVIATVKPGFATNGEDHAVVIDKWDEDGVHVVDPDARNEKSMYSDEYVRSYLTGACSVIPPIGGLDHEWMDTHPIIKS